MKQPVATELATHLTQAEHNIETAAEQLSEFCGHSQYSDSILTDLLKHGLIVNEHRKAVESIDSVDTASFEAIVECLEMSSELCKIANKALDTLKAHSRPAVV